MSKLYGRSARLLITHASSGTNNWFGKQGNQVEITGLRIEAQIKLSCSKHPNSAEIKITNCNKQSRAEFTTKPLIISLDAGYDNDLRHLFSGDLRYGHSRLENPDWTTTLQVADGDRAFREAKINKSYAAKTPAMTILKDLSGQMGLTLPTDLGVNGLLPDLLSQVQSSHVASGPAQAELTRLLDRYGCYWSIQNGRLIIQRDSSFTPGQAILVTKQSGLKGDVDVGVPEKEGTKKGNQVTAKFKMALYPGMYPGGLIRIDSRETQGFFKIKTVTHKIDTHGDDWDTDVEAIQISGA